MKKHIVRVLSFALLIVLISSMLTGCFMPEQENKTYVSGDEGRGLNGGWGIYAKVESDRWSFDINDVTLNFSYTFYCLDSQTIEDLSDKPFTSTPDCEDEYAIYLSKNPLLEFEDTTGKGYILDYQNNVNAKLYKHFTRDEIFEDDYGHTTNVLIINYNHTEELTIPLEFFDSENGEIFIYVVMLLKQPLRESFNGMTHSYNIMSLTTIEIDYNLNDSTVTLVE